MLIYSIAAQGQLSDNTPPTMWLERSWNIKENETIGSRIAQAHGEDAENQDLLYDLEPIQFPGNKKPTERLPFRIDPVTGTVYLNESLEGRAGQNLHLYVTAYDGELTAKTEVNVNILKSSARFNPSKPDRPPFPLGGSSSFNFPDLFNKRPSVPIYSNNPPVAEDKSPSYIPPRPYFQQKTYPESNTGKSQEKYNNTITELKPVPVLKDVIENTITEKTEISRTTEKSTTTKASSKEDVELTNELLSSDDVKSPPEFTATVIPIISVGAVFLTVGIIAVVFRKKIYIGKTKDSKEDMRKESSGSIVLREDPGINMQEWRAPRAFSNRYEPWQSDLNHTQVSRPFF
ncbi:hypothetical protein NQ317_010526 [Molorchus minor]|uniref:Cadherin domain-containing protein n=1 Tax=Molorchus minor TaxID=1323400 RepID=A0ABQ9JZK0_9CUCU|nr:hypothetical protein NQ317_010526 [Molorchus minor]